MSPLPPLLCAAKAAARVYCKRWGKSDAGVCFDDLVQEGALGLLEARCLDAGALAVTIAYRRICHARRKDHFQTGLRAWPQSCVDPETLLSASQMRCLFYGVRIPNHSAAIAVLFGEKPQTVSKSHNMPISKVYGAAAYLRTVLKANPEVRTWF